MTTETPITAAEMPALAPCPFCGGEAAFTMDRIGGGDVRCQSCCATLWGSQHIKATALWNRRAPVEPDEAMVERVARGLCKNWSAAVGVPACARTWNCPRCLSDARAAIAAMRGE